MYEIVYVLTVESTIFGLLGVMLVAQRWDVFSSTQEAAWPVLSSSLLLILAYSQLLLVLCCAIGVGQFGSLTYSLMDACARTAGRLVTCCVLCVCYICALLLISEHKNEQTMQCLLMQLFSTSCTEEGVRQFGGLTGVILHNVLWSFQTYFAVLVPLFLLVAGMQITAAGLCKDERRKSRARILCVNIPYVFTYYINYMLRQNVRCAKACRGVAISTITEEAELIFCKEILFFIGALYVSDIVAETMLVRRSIQIYSGRGNGQFLGEYLTMRISGVFVFGLLRVAQVLSIAIFNWFAEASLQLPSQLVLVHVILASVLAFLDIVQVVIEYAHPHKNSVEMLENNTKSAPEAFTKTDITVARNHTPFEVDTKHRKLLTFAGRSRWPAMLNANAEMKDRKSS